jgi:CHASE2 domain-containing sensor protein
MKVWRAIDRKDFREAAVAVVGSLTLSILMLGLALLARGIGFRPFVTIDSIDRQLVQRLAPRGQAVEHFVHPIVPVLFVDIDDRTISEYGASDDGSASAATESYRGRTTPRAMVAELVDKVAQQNPAAMFLDLDLRDPQPGDDLLRQALRGASVPVVVPAAVAPQSDQCLDAGNGPVFATVVDGIATLHRAHPYYESDSLGYVLGVCPALAAGQTPQGDPIVLMSAPLEALARARVAITERYGLAFPAESHDHEPVRDVYRVRFRVTSGDASLSTADENAPAIYRHVPAYTLKWPDVDLRSFKDALVIIGTSHAGSEQEASTALGPMPGALVHVNAALEAQAEHSEPASHAVELVVEIVEECLLCVALACVYGAAYVYIGRRWARRARTAARRNARYLIAFLATMTANATIAFLYYFVLTRYVFSNAGEYRLLAPLLVIAAELVIETLKAVTEGVEHVVEHAIPH